MPDNFTFDSTTSRFDLPLLYAGQAQKEAWVNESNARIDAILHCAIEGTRNDPPGAPIDGQCWSIGAEASGEWSGKDGWLAARQAGTWIFVQPQDGMRVFDRSTGQNVLFVGSWKYIDAPTEPNGGNVVDVEARAAITALMQALRVSGVFPGV